MKQSDPHIKADLGGHIRAIDDKAEAFFEKGLRLFKKWRLDRAAKSKAYLTHCGKTQTLAQNSLKVMIGLTFELLTICLGIVFLWFNALFFFLKAETVNLNILKPNAELWFSETFDGQAANVDSFRVDWIKSRAALALTADDIEIMRADGQGLLSIPHINTEFNLGALAFGKFEATRGEIHGGAVSIRRSADGILHAGLGTPETMGEFGPNYSPQSTGQDGVGDLETPDDLGVISRDKDIGETWKNLSALKLKNAKAYVIDEVDGLNWVFDDLNMNYTSDKSEFSVTAVSNLISQNTNAPLNFSLISNADMSNFDLDLSLKDFKPADLAPLRGTFAATRRLDAPVSVNMQISAGRDAGMRESRIEFQAGQGRLQFGDNWAPFSSASIDGVYNVEREAVDFTRLEIMSEQVRLRGQGEIKNIGSARQGFGIKPVDFKLLLSSLYVDVPQMFERPIDAARFDVDLQYDPNQRTFELRALDADLKDFIASFSGGLGLSDPADQDSEINTLPLRFLNIEGGINGVLSPQQVLQYWPKEMLLGARDYIEQRILHGDITDIKLAANVPQQSFLAKSLSDEDLSLSFKFKNAYLKYISTMTPLTQGVGDALLQGNSFFVNVYSAKLGEALTVNSGTVNMPRLAPKGGDMTLKVNASGNVSNMLRLIDEEPFNLASKANVKPDEFAGYGSVDFKLVRPLLRHVPAENIDYSVEGTFDEVSIPFNIAGNKIENGKLSVNVDKTQLHIRGPVNVGPWRTQFEMRDMFDKGLTPTLYTLDGPLEPDVFDRFGLGLREYFDGEIELSLNAFGDGVSITGGDIRADLTDAALKFGDIWSKPIGQSGQFKGRISHRADGSRRLENIDFTSLGARVAGSLELASNFKLKNLDLQEFEVDNFINASVRANASEIGDLQFVVQGEYLDVSPWFKSILNPTGEGESLPLLLTASLDKLILQDDFIVTDADAIYQADEVGIIFTRVKGKALGQNIATSIVQSETGLGRKLSVQLPDAGAALKSLYNMDYILGGVFSLEAELPPTGAPGGMKGTARVKDFQLVNAPVFARILSLASLQGLGEILSGEGMNFSSFEMPFTLEQGALEFEEATASGPAIGLTGTGYIDFRENEADIKGVVVPSYTINSMLAGIPLIGDIVVGKKGEGIFALNYTVIGPFEKTQVSVNPLSALTPGFLRQIFQPSQQTPLRERALEPSAPE